MIALSLLVTTPSASAAVKAGDPCKKVGQTATNAGTKFTSAKSGKKLIWNKGFITKVNKLAPTSTPTPTTPAPVVEVEAGDSCQKTRDINKNSSGPVECRAIAGEKLIWVQLSNTPPAIVNASTSDDVNVCKLPDLRTQKTPSQGMAFPLSQAAFSPLDEVRVAVIPFDFSDAPGEASLSATIDAERKKVDTWLAFNSKGKQTY